MPEAGELPGTIEAAEALQDSWMASLGPVGGYKLGATIPAVRESLGLPRAFFGPIPKDRIFQSGAEIPAAIARQTGVECEYAFRLGRDLPADGDPLAPEDVKGAFDAVMPAIEIPGTRFAQLGGHGGPALVADAAALGCLVLGEPVFGIDLEALSHGPVELTVDGAKAVSGNGAILDGGAFGPIRGFLAAARARGITLRAGEVVVTGSCTGYLVVPRGVPVLAEFWTLAKSVTLRFSA